MVPAGLSLAILSPLVIAFGVQLGAQAKLTKQDADRCEGKLDRISSFASSPKARGSSGNSAAPASQTTQLTDAELNAYLRFNLKEQVPAGVVEPTLSALGDGRVRGTATIDLDAVRKQKQRGWLDPMAYLTGSLPLTASGLLITKDGVGRFQLESAQISGVSVPKSLLQELLAYYSRTPENPRGISMDDPFELPAHIREIRVERGQATILQ